ncbi:MAG: DUF3089 domain-containing protein [Endomicrobiaceae bacterium]
MKKIQHYFILSLLVLAGQCIYASDAGVAANKAVRANAVVASSVTASETLKNDIAVSSPSVSIKNEIILSSDVKKQNDIKISSSPSVIAVSSQTVQQISSDTVKTVSLPPVSKNINISSAPAVSVSTVSAPQTVNLSSVTTSSKTIVFSIEDAAVTPQPDYSKPERWALLPEKQNAKVDVFYVYPTIFMGNGPEYMDVTNAELKERAKNQAAFDTGIFKGQANIYAPLYRQASIVLLQSSKDATVTSFSDIKRAFDYYLSNYNNGKPFFLAGFSQGSMAVLDLMKTKFHDKDLRNKLIAAYIIGYSVTAEDLTEYPFLKMAQNSDDTGIIISYNTQIAGNGYSSVLKKNSKAINPISWKTNNKPSKEKQYRGAVIFDLRSNKIISLSKPFKTACLEKDTNALVVDVDTSEYNASQIIFPAGVLHMYDYMFFYNNLQENVSERINSYLKKHK